METKNINSPVPQKKTSFFKDTIIFAIVALAIILPIRFFIAQPFIVDGASMDPTFETNQYLIVDEVSYRFEPISRGDVVIFKYPNDTSKYFIKRVIGLPGETVQIEGTKVTISNSKENPQSFTLTENYISPANFTSDHILKKLSENQYFVMGDNRGASFDSRAWGPVDKKYIIGRPIVRLFPVDKISFLPGESQVINR
jgi:signal peptidase I